MAVRAHDIALGDLGEDLPGPGSADHSRHAGDLAGAVTMVKVHGARRVPATAVYTRDAPKLAQQRCLLSPLTPLAFQLV
jgi:hypothetical protein